MGAGAGAELDRFEDGLQLLLQGPAAVGASEGGGQFGRTGIALFAQLQRDVEGQGRPGNVVEVAGVRQGIGGIYRRQCQGREVLA